jgi:hypothetical protein
MRCPKCGTDINDRDPFERLHFKWCGAYPEEPDLSEKSENAAQEERRTHGGGVEKGTDKEPHAPVA